MIRQDSLGFARIPWGLTGFAGIREDSQAFIVIRKDSLGFASIPWHSPGFAGIRRIREDSLGFAAICEDSLGFARIPKNSLVLRFSRPPNERSARAKRGRGATSLMPSSRLSWSPVVSPQTLFISLRDSLARIRLSNK